MSTLKKQLSGKHSELIPGTALSPELKRRTDLLPLRGDLKFRQETPGRAAGTSTTLRRQPGLAEVRNRSKQVCRGWSKRPCFAHTASTYTTQDTPVHELYYLAMEEQIHFCPFSFRLKVLASNVCQVFKRNHLNTSLPINAYQSSFCKGKQREKSPDSWENTAVHRKGSTLKLSLLKRFYSN